MPDKEAENGRSRLGAWLGAAPAVAGVLLAITGLTLGRLLVFGLLATAMLPWVAVSLRPAWPPLTYVLAAALTTVLAAFAATAVWYEQHPKTIAVIQVQDQPSLSQAASRLKFLPVAGPIPHCFNFAGTGAVPAGDALVLFDRPTDAAGNYTPTSTFSIDEQAAASPSGSGWTAPNVDIGSGDPSDQGSHIAIVAVLMPQGVADFLDNLTSGSDTGALPANVLSLGAKADQLVVVRNATNTHCSDTGT